MIDIEIDRKTRTLRFYDLDVKTAEGAHLYEKFMPITFDYLEKLLEFKDPLKKLRFYKEVEKAIKLELIE